MLEIDKISVSFGEFFMREISFTIEKGDYFVLLGQSGAGKSVLLEIISGLIKPDSGNIILCNNNITNARIQDRQVGIVFQDFSIFPHLTVKENIAYPLSKERKDNRDRIVDNYASLTEVSHLLNRYPAKLSGGELQRVALARTLVTNPKCILLDEPLSSLDVQLKSGLRNLLRNINKQGVTILHVTHDYYDAVALSNKVAVIQNGEIVQKGFTKDVFSNPANEFVANFTGVKNFFTAIFNNKNEAIINDNVKIAVVNENLGSEGKIIIKSKHIILSKEKLDSSALNCFNGKILSVINCIDNYEIIVDIGIDISVVISNDSFEKYNFIINDFVWVSFKSNAVKII